MNFKKNQRHQEFFLNNTTHRENKKKNLKGNFMPIEIM